MPLSSSRDPSSPYLSIVVTAPDDDRDDSLPACLPLFVDAWIAQAQHHRLSSELVIVDRSGGRRRLEEALRLPIDGVPCEVRIIEAPRDDSYRRGSAIHQAMARNFGIRRARGEFILLTDAAVLFSSELVEFLASRSLEPGRVYRIDRHEVMAGLPAAGTLDEKLDWCRSHVIRLAAREGTFPMTPGGFRQKAADDIARAGSEIYFGCGWFPVERFADGETFRWMENDAEIFARVPRGGAVMVLEVEPGPGIGQAPAVLQVLDENGAAVAEWPLSGRIRVELAVPPARTAEARSLRLRVLAGGYPVLDDPRILNLRAFHCDWAGYDNWAAPRTSWLAAVREHRPTLQRLLAALRPACGILPGLRRAPATLRAAVRLLRARGGDIFEAGGEFRFGQGWFELEHSGGERFRWAAQDAQLLLRISSRSLALLIEPGKGVGYRPFVLHIRDARGNTIARAAVSGLCCLSVPLPQPLGSTATLYFHVEAGGLPGEDDPRVLNFRVFAMGGESGNESLPDVYDCWSSLAVESRAPEIEWPARLRESRSRIAELGRPAFLHVNACPSFLLMSRQDWWNARGYPELDQSAANLDALLCYAAHYAGSREEILAEPLRIYRPADACAPQPLNAEAVRLITHMRALRVPFIFNSGRWGLAETAATTQEDSSAPYLSVVIAARNDNHGGNMLRRMQAFFDAWLGQSKRYNLSSEIIVVEWNPPADCPRLIDALAWPSDRGPCQVRFVEVTPETHRRFPHAETVPLHQMIAKNAGIRRARGEFVLATNLDIVCSAELMQFLALRRLQARRMYRIDRHDVSSEVPASASLDELLDFCRRHMLRVFTGEGGFALDSSGARQLEKEDIVAPEAGIRFGAGWYPVEAYEDAPFRWIAREADIRFQKPMAGSRLVIDVDTGPSTGGGAAAVEIVSREGSILASASVHGRNNLLVDIRDPISSGFCLRVLGGGVPLTRDLRMLNLRVFGLRWEREGEPAGCLKLVPTGPPFDWSAFVQAPSPDALRIRDARYLHTNACGDFTLLSRDDWFAMRAYPEFPIWPMHLDALFCYAAHHAAIEQVILREPMRIFHIEHLTGAGWTPEGEKERRARIAAKGVEAFEHSDVEQWVDRMRRFNAPVIFNGEQWGLAGETLLERAV